MWQGFAAYECVLGGTTFVQGAKVELDNDTEIQRAMIDKLVSQGVLTDRDPSGGGSRKKTRAERGDDTD